jgi:hypothetical protein
MVRSALLILALAAPALGQEPATAERALALSLNRLDAGAGACRLTFVADNALAPLSGLVLETVIFDRSGRVAALSLFDFGALPEARRRVRQFDVAGLACADLAQVLVNGVAACTGEGVGAGDCAAALTFRSDVEGVEAAQ